MKKTFRIAIVGMGGVGGFVGGKLATRYQPGGEIEIIFIARGENERVIRQEGLRLITSEREQVVHPSLITHDAREFGKVDLVILCTKSYDLESVVAQISPCITDNTCVLPLENGIDMAGKITSLLPGTEVWDGCIYLISRLTAPGIIMQTGNLDQIYFGSAKADKAKLEFVEKLFRDAGLNAKIKPDIQSAIWQKFSFISPLATLTSYMNITVGEISTNPGHRQTFIELVKELRNIAEKLNIVLPKDIEERNMAKLIGMPPESTSSMHSDFKKGNKTEVYSLTGYILELGKQLRVSTPLYEKMYQVLITK